MKTLAKFLRFSLLALGLFALIGGGVFALRMISQQGGVLPLARGMIQWLQPKSEAAAGLAESLLFGSGLISDPKEAFAGQQFPALANWHGIGATPDRLSIHPYVSKEGSPSSWIHVASSEALKEALKNAQAGQTIVIDPGTYLLKGTKIALTAAGRYSAPITVKAERLGEVILRFDMVSGFNVTQPFWNFENLVIRGACPNHAKCEHAFHITANAASVGIRNNIIMDFNAQLKVNGAPIDKVRYFPDNGIIEGNTLINSTARETKNPVTPIDIVAAKDWIVRGNLIADFVKLRGNGVSYGAFAKGDATGTVFEKNLIICAMYLPAAPSQVGLSIGGGGTNPKSLCRDGTCTAGEHSQGHLRDNIVMNCSDVGIYLNKGRDTLIRNNLLLNTAGIDSRFAESSALIVNNIVDGRIKERDGGTLVERNNLKLDAGLFFGLIGGPSMREVYADPKALDFRLVDAGPVVSLGEPLDPPSTDICGHARDSQIPDLGPIEYKSGVPCNPFDLKP
ncbi:hypothetical protein JCM17960_31170 [Magnetospira thiophila]